MLHTVDLQVVGSVLEHFIPYFSHINDVSGLLTEQQETLVSPGRVHPLVSGSGPQHLTVPGLVWPLQHQLLHLHLPTYERHVGAEALTNHLPIWLFCS